jgi:ferredoxin--NADP+ reductase
MHLDSLDRSRSQTATVVQNVRVTPDKDPVDVRRLTLNLAGPGLRFFEGQLVGFSVPAGDRDQFRVYTVADVVAIPGDEGLDLGLYVRRCGGPVSDHLCGLAKGERVTVVGPYDYRFRVPMDNRSNLVMIGAGSGIAPFRALVHKVYDLKVDWKGKVRLYFGPETGLETLYNNDPADVGQYFDRRTFRAMDALKTRRSIPGSGEPGRGPQANMTELWDLVRDPDSYVYVVGSARCLAALHEAMGAFASADVWQAAVDALKARNHWSEMVFD